MLSAARAADIHAAVCTYALGKRQTLAALDQGCLACFLIGAERIAPRAHLGDDDVGGNVQNPYEAFCRA